MILKEIVAETYALWSQNPGIVKLRRTYLGIVADKLPALSVIIDLGNPIIVECGARDMSRADWRIEECVEIV